MPAAATGGLLGCQTVCRAKGRDTGWARVRDEDGGCGRARLPDALLDIGEDGEAEVLLAGLLGVGASDDLCACASTSIAAPAPALAVARRLIRVSRTVLDGLLCVEAAVVLAPRSSRLLLLLFIPAGVRCTHVPCFPVKPWNSTLVSPLMRRFLMVSAYCDEPVAYDRVAALVSAERMGCLMACMVAVSLSRRLARCVEAEAEAEGYRD
jgi:hypothetical protein